MNPPGHPRPHCVAIVLFSICLMLLPGVAIKAVQPAMPSDPTGDPAALLARLYPNHAPFQQSLPAATPIPPVPADATSPTLSVSPIAHADAATSAAPTMLPTIFLSAHDAPPPVPRLTLNSSAAAMQTLTTETLTRPLVSPILATTSSGAPLLALADPYAGNPLPSRMVRPDMVAINHAGADEMMHKLKIDARRARFIMEFRQAYGPFARLEDLAQVNGITDTMLRSWEERDVIVLD